MTVSTENNKLTLLFLTASGENDNITCDSVHLIMRDGAIGNEGGSIGIRKGHVKSVIALQDGLVRAYNDENEIFSKHAKNAIAYVENDTVTVLGD